MSAQDKTGICPHCGTEIYEWFVNNNGYCPADGCHANLTVEELLSPAQVAVPEQP